jgi:hypothetical protein
MKHTLVNAVGPIRRLGTLLILAAALGGCAAIERQDAAGTEKLLAAAGFRAIPANSAERQRDLASLPREVVLRHGGGRTVYIYADARNCRCLYVGGPNDYAKYLELQVSEDIAGDTSAGSTSSAPTSFPVPASWEPQWEPDDWPWAPHDDGQWEPDVWVPGD